jgi:tetratricopeptide (TPR) repeat protein
VRDGARDPAVRAKLAAALNAEGARLVRAGDVAGAESMLREAVDASPENAAAHATLGVVLARSGRLDEAEREFEEAVRLDPSNAGFAGTSKGSGSCGEALEKRAPAARFSNMRSMSAPNLVAGQFRARRRRFDRSRLARARTAGDPVNAMNPSGAPPTAAWPRSPPRCRGRGAPARTRARVDSGGEVDAALGRVGMGVLQDVDELKRLAEEARAAPQARGERRERLGVEKEQFGQHLADDSATT